MTPPSPALSPGHFLKVVAAWLTITLAIFLLSMCVSGNLERTAIEWTSPIQVLQAELRGHHLIGPPLDDKSTFYIIENRYPRVVAAAIVGFALAAAGVALQALLRNPLADPYVLGISSGSTVGVMIWMAATQTVIAPAGSAAFLLLATGRSIPAVIGAVLTCILVFLLARGRWAGGGGGSGGGGMQPVTLLLVGVVISSMNGALLMVINTLGPQGLRADMATFLLGSISEGDLTTAMLITATVVLLVGYIPTLLAAAALNVGTLADTQAASLGINVQRLRTVTFICASIMTGAAILLSGPIGFVGLICPHICRRLRFIGGADHRLLLIAGPLCGASFLMLADSAVRVGVTLKTGEFPVGVVTALCGGPFFLFLLRRRAGAAA